MAARTTKAISRPMGTRKTGTRRIATKLPAETPQLLTPTPSFINLTNVLLSAAVLLLVGIAFFVGALWQKVNNIQPTSVAQTTNQQTAPQKQATLQDVKNVFNQEVIKFGDINSRVLVLEIADPSCPYCHAAAGLDPELNAQIGPNFKLVAQGGTYVAPVPEFRKLLDAGQIAYAYIYFPGHNNGEMGMKALYCANDQGKFWEAHDRLMTNAGYKLLNEQVKNDPAKLATLVNFLKGTVDTSMLSECIKSGKYDSRLNSDIALSEPFSSALGQNFGTPTFYVNEKAFPGAVNYNMIKSTVDSLLK